MGKIFTALERAAEEKILDSKKVPVVDIDDVFSGVSHQPFRKNLVTYSQPESIATEQFRKLRTQLLSLKLPKAPRAIMVTSATAGEGKTLVASNLGAVIAHDLNAHALLVDADFRNPTLSSWFGVKRGRGLSNYLTDHMPLTDLFVKTAVEKLTIVPGGSIAANPVELIGSPRMVALVEELKTRYQDRYIIFDTSPLLATTEPSVLTRVVDGIILVIRAGVTPRETIQQAIATLDPDKIVGVVLNDLQFKSSALFGRYFGAPGYYYRYRDKSKDEKSNGFFRKLVRRGK